VIAFIGPFPFKRFGLCIGLSFAASSYFPISSNFLTEADRVSPSSCIVKRFLKASFSQSGSSGINCCSHLYPVFLLCIFPRVCLCRIALPRLFPMNVDIQESALYGRCPPLGKSPSFMDPPPLFSFFLYLLRSMPFFNSVPSGEVLTPFHPSSAPICTLSS